MQSVAKQFQSESGSVSVLESITLDVHGADFVALTGPSGSGKTTFLHLASLLDRPSSGTIVINGINVSSLDEYELSQTRTSTIGMVFQNSCLLSDRTVFENVLLCFRYTRVPRAEQIKRTLLAMKDVGVDHLASRRAGVLSAGEMQRTAIARAIANKPAIIIADEPTGNLDSDSADRVMDCFRKLHARGIAIIMATHNQSLIQKGNRHFICRNRHIEEEHY